MKKNRLVEFFYGLRGTTKPLLVLTGLFILSFTSCSKENLDEPVIQESLDLQASSKAASAGSSITEIQFTAVALIEDCHGENIRFTGTIENRVAKTTDARGVVHYTRSFRTKGMTGIGLLSGTEYDVIGGAEMFAIKDAVLNPDGGLNLSGSIAESDIVIHQGTLVFQSRTDGSRVVARHIIRKVPGSDITINEWKCGGKA